MSKCRECDVELITGENWSISRSRDNRRICKTCSTKLTAMWRDNNRSRVNELSRISRYRHGAKPMSENRKCSAYLGIHIAERVLAKTFKDVEVMPPNNKGYDFICNKGKKIDVKSACFGQRGISWTFSIKRNTVADYFLCIAFDNRDDLNPLYVWLIPGDKVNHVISTTISESTINKWSEHVIDIDSVLKYCDIFKNL